MEFVKRNLLFLICGVVALASVGLGAWGMSNKSIQQRMEESASAATELNQYQRGPRVEGRDAPLPPINQAAIENEKKRIEQIKKNHKAVLAEVAKINARPMLRNDVFPQPQSVSAPFNFRNDYRNAMNALWTLLNDDREQKYGTVPTDQEIRAIQAMMAEDARTKSVAEKATILPPTIEPGGPRGEPTAARGEPRKAAENLPPEERIRQDARVHACVKRAREINCYISREALDILPSMSEDRPPTPEDMWLAQMTYLVQKDVLDALRNVNQAAAEKLKAQQKQAWVGDLPVKAVRKILVGGGSIESLYVRDSEEGPRGSSRVVGGGGEKAEAFERPPGFTKGVFTQHGGAGEYDVIQFSVYLVVNPRYIPTILSEISKVNFYVPLNVRYEAVSADKSLQGAIYGSEPVVQFSVDFEAFFFREIYEKFMPPKVKEKMGAAQQAGVPAAPPRAGRSRRNTGGE